MKSNYRPAYYPGARDPWKRVKKPKKTGNQGALHWLSPKARKHLIASLRYQDGSDCKLCGKPLNDDVTIDHIIEQADGGTDEISNLRLAHARCNAARNSHEAGVAGYEKQIGATE